MKTIFGRDCTLTVIKDNVFTAIPYTSETVRSVTADYALAGTVGKKARTVRLSYAEEIVGCFVTRLTNVCAPCLFGLIKEHTAPFDILVNRVVDKVLYKNVRVCGFELRGRLDGAVYLRLDITGSKESYTETPDVHTTNIFWEKVKTYYLRDGHFSIQGVKVPQVYLYTLTGSFKEKSEYELRLHAPLQNGHILSTAQNIERLDYALSAHAAMSFFNLVPKAAGNASDASGAVLVNRTYRVDGVIGITVQNGNEYWSAGL